MNSTFNRQFMMFDFALLDDPNFLEFVKAPVYATYLLQRRHIWRGGQRRVGNLDLCHLYEEQRLLPSLVDHHQIAAQLRLKDPTRISKHVSELEQIGVLKRIRTGRQNVYVLGEWLDISEEQDGSKRVEWFYLDRKFGKKSDLAWHAKSELVKTPNQSWRRGPSQSWRGEPNRNKNKEDKYINNNTTVNVNGFENADLQKTPNQPQPADTKQLASTNGFELLKQLPDLQLHSDEVDYIAKEIILKEYQDDRSLPAYRLIAAKVPQPIISTAISEIRVDGARTPVKAFMYRMKEYAKHQLNQT